MENKMILIKEQLFYDAGYEPTPQRLLDDVSLMIEKGFDCAIIFDKRYDYHDGSYDGIELEFSQFREETEQEKEKRLQREKENEEQQKSRRREMYEQLRQEFGE
jgi:hypothetical protein